MNCPPLLKSCKLQVENKHLTQLILRYLLKNPDAGDTLEGITHWWVTQEIISTKMNEVMNVVSRLCSMGFLIEKFADGGKTRIYIVNKEKLTDILSMLNQNGNQN